MIYPEQRIYEDDKDQTEIRLIKRNPSANITGLERICHWEPRSLANILMTKIRAPVICWACLCSCEPVCSWEHWEGGEEGEGQMSHTWLGLLLLNTYHFLLLKNCQQHPSNFLLDICPLHSINRQFMLSLTSKSILSLSHLPASQFPGQKVMSGSLTPNIWCK